MGIFVILIISALAFLMFCVLCFRDDDAEIGTFFLVIGICVLLAGSFGTAHRAKENFAESFKTGYYTVDANAIIQTCDDDIDAFALELKSKGVDTIKIEKNKGKIATEFVCIVEGEGKDLTFYLDPYDAKELIEIGAMTSK